MRRNFAELGETVRNRAFVILMLASVCGYANQGIGYALSNYLYTYVWGLKGPVLVYLTVALFIGVVAAFVAAPRIGKRTSKPGAGTVAVVLGALFATAPYWLRLVGVFPEPGSPMLLPVLLCFSAGSTACNVTAFILAASMMADVVEDSEAKTGRRSEGVFFAGSFFVQKCTSGIGIAAAGLILSIAGFPEHATPGRVPEGTLDRLTLIFAANYLVIALLAAFFFSRFPFGRNEHDARIARLAGDAAVDGGLGRP